MTDIKAPENFKLLYPSEEIAMVVRKLGSEITAWAKSVREEQGEDLIAIPVLRGGIFFFADLVRHTGCSVEMAPVQTWAYEQGQNNEQREQVKIRGEVGATNRSVLLIDDVCDSGRTLKALTERMFEIGAKEVKSAVLIKRSIEQEIFEPDYIGFEYPGSEWFVGYGMEDRERWRNLPSIYTLQTADK